MNKLDWAKTVEIKQTKEIPALKEGDILEQIAFVRYKYTNFKELLSNLQPEDVFEYNVLRRRCDELAWKLMTQRKGVETND